jgi:DNA-binding MarR family transcriptional regulator
MLEFAKTQAVLSRRFDSGLGGIGLSEFTILYTLSIAAGEKMRRIDLANAVGLTASGVTRQLLPMEKIGLVKSGEPDADARARYVMIARGGKVKLQEAIERMDVLLDEIMPTKQVKQIKDVCTFVSELGARANIR